LSAVTSKKTSSAALKTQFDAPGTGELPTSAQENLDVVASFHEREDAKVSGLQLVIERISDFFGSPAYFAFAVAFIVLWIGANVWGAAVGWEHVDEPPFFWLQGIVSGNALLLTIAVLIRQSRMSQLAEHRAHLDLQINLLTEQKVTKLLQMFDELRSEMPARHGRDDEVAELAKPADAEAILHAIEQQHEER
jgi:uncharacterized membrane protein